MSPITSLPHYVPKSVVCEEDPYLLELIRYIHLNPLTEVSRFFHNAIVVNATID